MVLHKFARLQSSEHVLDTTCFIKPRRFLRFHYFYEELLVNQKEIQVLFWLAKIFVCFFLKITIKIRRWCQIELNIILFVAMSSVRIRIPYRIANKHI